MHQILLANGVQKDESIFKTDDVMERGMVGLYNLKPEISFHFFSSQAPCKTELDIVPLKKH